MAKMKVMASKKNAFAFIWSSRGRIKAEIQGKSEQWSKLVVLIFFGFWLKYSWGEYISDFKQYSG